MYGAHFDRNLHSMMPFSFTLLLRLKRAGVCPMAFLSGVPLLLPVGTVNCVQTLKAKEAREKANHEPCRMPLNGLKAKEAREKANHELCRMPLNGLKAKEAREKAASMEALVRSQKRSLDPMRAAMYGALPPCTMDSAIKP
jgi:hypothetical protein